jgi:hypothetical protein
VRATLGQVAILTVAVLATLSGAVAVSGCGFGPGEASSGEAYLRVTRDFGTVPMVDATLDDPTESDTVVRFLDQNADIETSYGGNFVDSIDGYAGSTSGGGDDDWFFFVNGYYSEIGGGERKVVPGDRIWWDYRYWNAAYRVPAVVGSWPEPFLHGYDGKHYDTVVECLGGDADCGTVVAALGAVGVRPGVESAPTPVEHPDELRVLVGPWRSLRADPAARQLEAGPERSGVYARLVRCGADWRIEPVDSRGQPTGTLERAGLVAAVRAGGDQPTWVVTGTDDASVADAVALLDADSLADRYAVATAAGEVRPLPDEGSEAGATGAPDPCR